VMEDRASERNEIHCDSTYREPPSGG